MKKILITLCALSVMPILSLARKPAPILKPAERPHAFNPSGKAFNKVPLRPVGPCVGTCATRAGEVLSPQTVRAVNRGNWTGQNANVVGHVLEAVPTVMVKMTINGEPVKQANMLGEALVAAANESGQWGDLKAQQNVVNFAKSLATEGMTPANRKMAEEVKENCRL